MPTTLTGGIRRVSATANKVRGSDPERASEHAAPPKVLSVSADETDHLSLKHLLAGIPCHVVASDTCDAALQKLSLGDISVVVCDAKLPDGTWLDILDWIRDSSKSPPLIVTSRLADEYLWAEVLNLGGFDVIAKPFSAPEALHVLEMAFLSRQEMLGTNRPLAVAAQ
jgi:DNA-binding response OmpR family regulator